MSKRTAFQSLFPRRRSKPRDFETIEQEEVVNWLREKEILFTASANGARTSWKQVVKLKRLGVTAGAPDLMIFEPRGAIHGLLIEMKRKAIPGVCDKGSASPEQKRFIARAIEKGYLGYICYGAEEAIKTIGEYLAHGGQPA